MMSFGLFNVFFPDKFALVVVIGKFCVNFLEIIFSGILIPTL